MQSRVVVINQGAKLQVSYISHEHLAKPKWVTGTDHSDVPVHGEDALVGRGLEQFGGDDLLNRKHDAILAAQTNHGSGNPAVNCYHSDQSKWYRICL